MNQEKLICIRYPDNKCDRIPRSKAEMLVNNGQAVFTSKSRYHVYLKEVEAQTEKKRQEKRKTHAKKRRT